MCFEQTFTCKGHLSRDPFCVLKSPSLICHLMRLLLSYSFWGLCIMAILCHILAPWASVINHAARHQSNWFSVSSTCTCRSAAFLQRPFCPGDRAHAGADIAGAWSAARAAILRSVSPSMLSSDCHASSAPSHQTISPPNPTPAAEFDHAPRRQQSPLLQLSAAPNCFAAQSQV